MPSPSNEPTEVTAETLLRDDPDALAKILSAIEHAGDDDTRPETREAWVMARRSVDRIRDALRRATAGESINLQALVIEAYIVSHHAWEQGFGHGLLMKTGEALERALPHAKRAIDSMKGARKGGQKSRKAPPGEQLAAKVLELHRTNPRLSWTGACGRIGKSQGISGRAVQRYTAHVKW